MRVFQAILLGGTVLAAACGGGASGGTAGGGAGNASSASVSATMSDKDIVLDQASVSAGKVTFKVKNAGTVVHSMVVIKTNLDEAKLPADAKDPGKVDERGSLGATGQIAKGDAKDLTLELSSGKYVLVCNEPAHYIVGMHVAFTVK